MIPIQLELQAFLPFKDHLLLDFSAVQEEKIFLITGRTGAGKTALFDAISFALFGEPSAPQRDSATLKSQFADLTTESFVSFTFQAQGNRYTIRRTPQQPKQGRGGVVRTASSTAVLTLPDGTLLTRINEVKAEIERILGLNAEQFKKIVMLPQGEFRRFLSDSSADKQEILRKIFDTSIYDAFTDLLRERCSAAQTKLDKLTAERESLLTQIEPLDDESLAQALAASDYPSIQAKLTEWVTARQAAVSALEQQKNATARTLHTIDVNAARAFNQKLTQYETAKQRRQTLLAQQDEHTHQKAQIQKLLTIKEVHLSAQNVRTAKQKQQTNEAQSTQLQAELARLTQQLQEQQQAYTQQRTAYEALPQTAAEIAQLEQQLTLFARRTKHLAEAEEKTASLAKAKQIETALSLQEQLTVHQQTLSLLGRAQSALSARQTAQAHAQTCFTLWQTAYQSFLSNQAAILAQELKPNTPCPVCGSLHHPAPAHAPEGETVSKETLDRLSADYETARQQLEQAQSACQMLQTQLELPDDRFTAETLTIQQTALQQQITDLHTQLPNLSTAPYTAASIAEHIHTLEAEHTLLLQTIEELNQTIADSQLTEPAVRERIAALRRHIAEQTKRFEQLEESVRTLRTQHDRTAEALRQTQALTAQYQKEAEQAQAQYRALLSQYQLTEPEPQALSAQLPQLPTLQEQSAQYDTELAALTKLLETNAADYENKQPYDLTSLQEQAQTLTARLVEETQRYETLLTVLDRNQRLLQSLQKSADRHTALSAQYSEIAALYQAASGKNERRVSFERYVLAAYFDRVIDSANLRLRDMTDSRYFLKRREDRERGNASSGLDLEIFDSYSGQYRHVNTLSGGESFKTALCLALGLADVITQSSGGVEIDTVFIDEGFGTLDAQALDSAINCLYTLKNHGRIIGIISHVRELQEKIPVKLLVEPTKDGSKARFK